MNEIKLTTFTVLMGLIFSSQLNASTQTFQASVTARSQPQIAELQNLHFGYIDNNSDAICSLNAEGTATGNCEASSAKIQTGLLNISGIGQNTQVSISISGSSNGTLKYTAQGQIAQLSNLLLVDSEQVLVTSPSDSLQISVFGDMQVESELTSGATYTVDYTLSVNFQ